MAGIGFELRKIYGKKTLASNVWGTVYATMTTVGPSIMFASLLLVLKYAMDYANISELESRFFISSFTYVSLVSIVVSAIFNTIVSRYVSDCIFEKRENDICASVFGVMTSGSVVSGFIMLCFCIAMHVKDQIPIEFLLIYYILGVLTTAAYNMMTYVSAMKQYTYVTISYFAGLIAGIITYFICVYLLHIHIVMSAYIALTTGFFLINFLMIIICVRAFGKPSDKCFDFLTYIFKHPKLLISGSAYMMGFYITSITYWNLSDISEQISIFKTSPNYDMAFFLAIIVNMPALVIFVVKAETAFYEKYVAYLSALNKGTYRQIEKERENISNTIRHQLFFIYEVQLIVVIVLVCLVNVLFPYINVSSQILNMFMVLSMGLYSAFCMYFTVVFLYYFDDQTGACYGPVIFLVVSLCAALLFSYIGKPYYPLAILLGGISGWIAAFLRLRKILLKLNAFLMCK